MLKIYNSKTHKKEEFVPLDDSNIKMYVCGPTVYNEIHIGNARSAIVFDILNRVLRCIYPKVTYVRNITDIDDKIIIKAKEENKSCEEVAKYWNESYQKNCEMLQLLIPDSQPKATDVVKEIIEFIANLIENDFAYEKDGSVFFRISELKTYGELSNNSNLLEANRISVNENKDAQNDFVLWKPSKLYEPYWRSPWGEGRPGWHIECSAMGLKYLGESFDIHGGGQDLLFPHHENENAQNKALNGDKAGPKYWMHNAMLLMNKEKMSKSLGNIVLLSDIFKNYHPIFIKFYILNTHYRHMLNFELEILNQLALKFDLWIYHLGEYFDNELPTLNVNDLYELLEDLNLPGFFVRFEAILNLAIKNNDIEKLKYCAGVLKFLGLDVKILASSKEVKSMAKERQEAQIKQDYKRSDELREQIAAQGFVVIDKKSDYIIKYNFSSILIK